MINYDTLKELALVLSKITGYRYVAFCESNAISDLLINFSNSQMRWYPTEVHPYGFWVDELDCQLLDLGDLPFLNWSECQFDCEEK